MVSDISRLVAAWVSAQQRHFHNSTRGIATVEQRLVWEREAEEIIAQHDREVAAKALRDAAKDIYLPGDRPSVYVDIAYAEQLASQYLRARADQIEEGDQ